MMSKFQESMASKGLACPDPIIPDGEIHRFHVSSDNPGSKNGWYVFFGDSSVPGGSYGSWKIGETFKWSAKKISEMTISERAKYQRQIVKAKAARDEELRKVHLEAREKALRIWKATKQVDKHPYLENKGLTGSYNLHVGADKRLIVPIIDLDGKLHSIQRITSDGDKRFLTGGAISGHFYPINGTGDTLLVCEGFATGATLHEVTCYPIVCAMNCGNLLPVCKILREEYPSREIVVCADDDWNHHDSQGNPDNPGLTSARAAAQAIGAKLAVPQFKDQEHRGTDFNDLQQIEGQEAVRLQIEEALRTEALEAEEGPGTSLPCLLPVPIDVFPDDLQEVIEALHQAHGTSYEVATTAILVIAGSLIGWSRQLVVKSGWYVHASLYAATEAETGEGKSPTTDFFLRPVERLEHQEFLKWKQAKENYDEEKKKYPW